MSSADFLFRAAYAFSAVCGGKEMQRRNAIRLTNALLERVGETLRSVSFYSPSGMEMLHLRDDIDRENIQQRVAPGLEILRRETQLEDADALPFPNLNATVHLFDEGVLIHFPQGPDQGTIVTLESDVARQLNQFVKECASYLE